MSGFSSCNSGHHGPANPCGVPNPTRKATNTSTSPFVWSRRYLDWNRYTFTYHTVGTQDVAAFDVPVGEETTKNITQVRIEQNLGKVYGCVPEYYCMRCVPFGSPTNIFTMLADAMATMVVNEARANVARLVVANTGSVRYDLYKGPFTYDDNFIVSPFRDTFLYIPEVPYDLAKGLVDALNANSTVRRKRDDYEAMYWEADSCVNPVTAPLSSLDMRDVHEHETRGIKRRQELTPGYTTKDDFGTDGTFFIPVGILGSAAKRGPSKAWECAG